MSTPTFYGDERQNIIEISNTDYWVKVVEFLQQNWALIENSPDSSTCTIYFIHDGSGMFDSMQFPSERKAITALKRNGFERHSSKDNEFQECIPAPQPPFYETEHPSGRIYSSGLFWRKHYRDQTLEKLSGLSDEGTEYMPRLFSYKLSHDTGFAPNPFWGVLTLATCKPIIRKFKLVGDWIAGFTSKRLCNDDVGEERLIFLMKVKHKLSIANYFNDKKYVKKIPDMTKVDTDFRCGDNIYKPDNHISCGFQQLSNPYHNQNDMLRDISGEFVLISDEFYYFGVDAIKIPKNIRPIVPKGQSSSGSRTDELCAQQFIDWIKSSYSVGRHGKPHSFPASSHITGDNNRSCGNKRP
jgi:hypothetical protein